MAIKIFETRPPRRTVPLNALAIGDTFLYDDRIGVVVARNGHKFYLDLTTCTNFRHKIIRPLSSMVDYGAEIDGNAHVIPVQVNLTYQVVG